MDEPTDKPDRPSVAQSVESAQHSMDEKVQDARDTFNTAVEGEVKSDAPINPPASPKRHLDYTPGGTIEQSVHTQLDEKAIADAKAAELKRFDEIMGPGHDVDHTNDLDRDEDGR